MRRSSAVPLSRAYLGLAALAATAGLSAACGDREQNVYCADSNGVVVDDHQCDDRNGPYYLHVGPYGRGLRPGARLSGGQRISYTDSAARSRYGLSSSGHVSNGTAVSGGFGGSGHSSGS